LFLYHSHSLTPCLLLQDIFRSSSKVYDKSSGDLQQDIGDQPQLPIAEVPESSSAEKSNCSDSSNTLCCGGKLPNFFEFPLQSFFVLLAVFLTNLPSVQGTLAVILLDEVKAKLIEVLHC
jgi:hypothetical protein